MKEILEEYNSKYGTELTLEDVKYVRNTWVKFLGIDSNNTYVYDYREETPVEDYVEPRTSDIYSIINKKDNKIIASLGKIETEIRNIDAKAVQVSQTEEYFESDKKIDLTKNKTPEEIKQIYETLGKQCEKVIEKQNEEKRQKRIEEQTNPKNEKKGFELGQN